MKQKRHSSEWALIVLAAIFLAVLASRAGDVESVSTDRGFVSFQAQNASLFLFRDQWLGNAQWPLGQTRYDRASLELFNQFAVRSSFDTAPDYVLRAVPGIGARLSASLIEFREAKGGRISSDQLRSIPGIGPKTADALEKAFVFGPPEPPPDPIKIRL